MCPIPHDKENAIATFMELGLSEKTLNAVAALDYTEPTPVQEQAIPFVLEGRDVIAAAKSMLNKRVVFITIPPREIFVFVRFSDAACSGSLCAANAVYSSGRSLSASRMSIGFKRIPPFPLYRYCTDSTEE